MDWRFLAGGIAMVITGSVISIVYGSFLLHGPLEAFNLSRGIAQMGAIIGAMGVLLTLVSFGLGRRKRRPDEGAMTSKEDKPS